jgi:DamX protein
MAQDQDHAPSQAVSTETADAEQPVKDADTARQVVQGRDWILQQQSTDYTFQLMGAWEASEVDAFIEKNALTGQVARFTSLRNRAPWHVLVYGVYPSKQAALDASNQWPAPMNTLPTWLRRFDSVQKQIREKGVAAQ